MHAFHIGEHRRLRGLYILSVHENIISYIFTSGYLFYLLTYVNDAIVHDLWMDYRRWK